MKKLYHVLTYCLCILSITTCNRLNNLAGAGKDKNTLQRFEFESPHMGTLFRLVFYAPNESLATTAADSVFLKIEELEAIMSHYREESELNQLSSKAGSGEAVPVSSSLFYVIKKAQSLAYETEGAFDITIGPYMQLWNDIRNNDNPRLPDENKLLNASKAVGYEHISLNEEEQTITLARPGMHLDLGGIGKGYAVDEALNVLHFFGIRSALVDGGGDVVLGDAPPNREGWNIVIPAHNRHGAPDPVSLVLRNKAMTSSGDMFQFIEIDGIRYSHIIDPRSGLGLRDRRTVTVIGNSGIAVDAYATTLSILSPTEGLKLVENKEELVVFMEINKNSSIRTIISPGFKKMLN